MSYCYFGSRFYGTNPVLNIFYKYNIVFAGTPNADKYKNKFKAGTKIAICEGKEVQAIGIAQEDFNSIDNLNINFLDEEKKLFEIKEWVLAVKVKIFKLEKEDYFEYDAIISGFKPINTREDIKKKIDELIKKYSGEQAMEDIKKLLKQNKNLILTGAPGTGKTYLAKQIAGEIGECEFVQFHPSYDYTDFVEGLRPIKDEKGNIGFERRDGVFKEFCKKALNNQNSDFVFIIDEINRGEISKIFGELFFSVDPGYRGEKGKVQTQYSNLIEDDEFKEGFYIPENVYIIGTMNDIDRSVESMDFAIRRRFAWKEIKAKDTQESILNNLKEAKDLKDKAVERMDSLNEAVSKTQELSDAYHIGASYFLKLDNYYNENNEEEAFENLWENHLKGLLFEYTRGMPNQETILEELKNAYDLNN